MKSLFFILVVSVSLVLQSCGSNFQPQDVRSIAVGTPRAGVEEILGEPVARHDTNVGLIYTYSVTYDSNESDAIPSDLSGCVGGCAAGMLLLLPATLIVDAAGVFDEEAFLTVIYDEQERMSLVLKGDQTGTLLRAANGDSQARYLIASKIEQPVEKWRWLCRAAYGGHSKAAYEVSQVYINEGDAAGRNQSKALIWLTLASSFFEAEDQTVTQIKYWRPRYQREIAALKDGMTPAEIAEAERLLAEWEPNPAECDQTAVRIDY